MQIQSTRISSKLVNQAHLLKYAGSTPMHNKPVKVYALNQSTDVPGVLSHEVIQLTTGNTDVSPLLKEIMEQPAAMRRLLASYPKAFNALQLPKKSIQQLVLLAEGSSNHALSIAAPYLASMTGLNIRTLLPFQAEHLVKQHIHHNQQSNLQSALIIAASQSGKSASTMRAIQLFSNLLTSQDKFFSFIPITNNAKEVMAKTYGNHIDMLAGPEEAIAATKSMTNTITAGLLLGSHLAKTSDNNLGKQIVAELSEIPDKLEKFLTDPRVHMRLKQLANKYAKENRFVILSTDAITNILPEAGLKMTETTESWVKTDNMESFKHGPKVILGQSPVTLYVIPPSLKPAEIPGFFKDMDEHFRANGKKKFPSDKIHFMVYQNSPEIPQQVLDKYGLTEKDNITKLPSTKNIKKPLESQYLGIVTFQLFSYYLALAKGLNPNHSALTKAVTQ